MLLDDEDGDNDRRKQLSTTTTTTKTATSKTTLRGTARQKVSSVSDTFITCTDTIGYPTHDAASGAVYKNGNGLTDGLADGRTLLQICDTASKKRICQCFSMLMIAITTRQRTTTTKLV